MADELQSSQVATQVEYQEPPDIRSSQVTAQVEYQEPPLLRVSQVVAQVEYVGTPFSTQWRLYITGGNSAFPGLSTFEMHGTIGGSDQCSGGTASASTTYGGTSPDYAFDGNSSTYWLPTGAAPQWIQYTFASAVTVVEYVMAARQDETTQVPRDWQLQYYDGSGWQTYDQQSGQVSWGTSTRTFICPTVENSAYRIVCTTANSGYFGLATFELHSTVGGSDQCSGGQPSASSHYDPTNWPSSNAFDGNNSTYWDSNGSMPQWIQYTFSSAKSIVEYKISPRQDSRDQSPQAWDFQRWNGYYWETVDSRSGVTVWEAGQYRTFPIAANSAYRIYVTEANDSYCGICTLEMHGTIGGADLCNGSGGNAICSGNPGSFLSTNAFDNNSSTAWVISSMPQWLMFQFPTAQTVVEYKLAARQDALTQSPKAWEFQRWDGSQWQTVHSQSNVTSWSLGQYRSFAFYCISGLGGGIAGGSATIVTEQPGVVVGTGGGIAGGSATIATGQGYVITGTGGGIAGGSAAISVNLNLSITGSGGGIAGGTAVIITSDFYAITGSGGGIAGGSATFVYLLTYSISGTGGGLGGGTGAVSHGRVIAGSGGGIAGGSATFAYHLTYSISGTGGGIAGGSASIETGGSFYITGTGGAIAGGSAAIAASKTHTISGSGGGIAGGSATIAFTRNFAITGSGGGIGGGSASIVFAQNLYVAGTGGAIAGGATVVIRTESVTGLGGGVAGGTSEVVSYYSKSITGTGGAIAGGSATISRTINLTVVGSGGGVAGGTAPPTYNQNLYVAGSGGGIAGGIAPLEMILMGGGIGGGAGVILRGINLIGTGGGIAGGEGIIVHKETFIVDGSGGGIGGGTGYPVGSGPEYLLIFTDVRLRQPMTEFELLQADIQLKLVA